VTGFAGRPALEMHGDTDQTANVHEFARRRRLLYAGLWLVVAEIIVTLAAHELQPAFDGPALWLLLLGPAAVYLLCLWRIGRCPACGAPLIVDAGPYQRVVFNFNAQNCPRCGASLQ